MFKSFWFRFLQKAEKTFRGAFLQKATTQTLQSCNLLNLVERVECLKGC